MREPLPDAEVPPLDVRSAGVFARGAHVLAGDGLLVVYEIPVHLHTQWGEPRRLLAWLDTAGRELARREATPGRQLLDAAVHPSREITVVEASEEGYFLLRIDAQGRVIGETQLTDAAILTDPPAILPSESRSPIEEVTHDTARIAADGDGVLLATRTGRHSVVAYRLEWSGSGFAVCARTLVVPAHPIAAIGLTGGSYDTFGQLDAHYGVFVAVDAARTGWVGVGHARLELGAMVKAHEKVFGEKLVTDPDRLDAFVTRISPDGQRLGTSVVSTPDDDQLYGLRATGRGVYALGRTEHWNAEGTGFDALLALIDASGAVAVQTFDVERSDIAFDVAAGEDGDLVVVGASGYSQNPYGASISEASHAFALRLQRDGALRALPLPDGPRHNEARFVVPRGRERLVVGGMLDGPGTHSADADAALLRAAAFITER